MSDWSYIAGSGGFNQDFKILNPATGEPLDLTGGTITMFIQSSDFQTNFPTDGNGTPMTIEDAEGGIARLIVQTTFMPQDEGIYIAQIKIIVTATVRTFLINLRVVRQIGN